VHEAGARCVAHARLVRGARNAVSTIVGPERNRCSDAAIHCE
jgi:hypothetical protein